MYFVVSDRDAGTRLGQPRAPVAGTSGPVALFSCSEAGRKKIEAIVGRTVSEDDLRKAIRGAIDKATSLAAKAIGNLRSATRSSATRELLLEVFGTFPEAVPTWRAASADWKDLGELVALRLERAAGILRYGKLQFHCWGCPGGSRDPSTYSACNHPRGTLVIGLGGLFWDDWRTGDTERMAMVLLHEAIHVYYPSIGDNESKGKYSNAYCYQRFVPEMSGLRLYPEVEKACPSVLRRGSRGPEVEKLQRMLNRWILPPRVSMSLAPRPALLAVDGSFDRLTDEALRAFQREQHITPDGVTRGDTWQRLIALP